MAEFPTYEQMAKDVAEKALDEYLIDGKSIRGWIKIISEQEQKQEHWIDMNHYEEWWGKEYKCSECGGRMIGATEYCPYCGVRMSEVEQWIKKH